MKSFAWWSVRHRWWVIGGWVILVLVLAELSQAAGGATYKNNFTFSGYDSQRAQALLQQHFPQAAGDSDQIVVHTSNGTVTDPRDRLQAMFARVARLPEPTQTPSDALCKCGMASVTTTRPDGRRVTSTLMRRLRSRQRGCGKG